MKQILLKTLLFIYLLPVSNCQTDWTYSSLSQKKRSMGAVAIGSKVWFAGGEYYVKNGNGAERHVIDTVEIFDTKDQSKSFAKLSVARSGLNVATAGGKIFFAGGIEGILPSGFFKVSDIVDIYDTSTGIWSVEKLSVARYEMVSTVVGDKVIFAGGRLMNYHVSDVVDIYDVSTGLWSQQQLPMPTFGMGVAVAENKVYFAGGFDVYPKDNPDYFVRKRIDIYDVETDAWSIDSLSQARCYVGGAVVRDRILLAGGSLGLEQSNRVDIFNLKTKKWSMDSLSVGRSFLNNNVATVCDKVHFVGGDCYNVSAFLVGFVCNYNQIDIYDYQTNQWSQDTLPNGGLADHIVLAVEDNLLVAGGITLKGWFPTLHDEIIIRPCNLTPTNETMTTINEKVDVYPNPAGDQFFIRVGDEENLNLATLIVKDSKGNTVMYKQGYHILENHDISNWNSSIYFVYVNVSGYGPPVKLVVLKQH